MSTCVKGFIAVVVLATTVAFAPAASAHYEGSATGAIEKAALDCPFEPTSSGSIWYAGTTVPYVLPGPSCIGLANFAEGRKDHAVWTVTDPALLIESEVHEYALEGGQPGTEPVTFATAAVGQLVEQVNSLAELLWWYSKTYVLNDVTTSTETSVQSPNGEAALYNSLALNRCLTLDCLTNFPTSLPGSVGCLPPTCSGPYTVGTVLSVQHTLGTTPYPQPEAAPTSSEATDSGGGPRLQYWSNMTLQFDRNKESGGPNKLYGFATFDFYFQNERFHPTWDFAGTSQNVTVTPVNGCKLAGVQSLVEPHESVQIAGWAPSGVNKVDADGSQTITAGLSNERGAGGPSFEISRTWTKFEGLSGAQFSEHNGHVALWQSGTKEGNANTKGATAVETWKKPHDGSGFLYLAASAKVRGC